jgi:alkanesulfonate monooxygenase SsuD/methylene tetrahydromethanopterin reductase-like flavin-dependent oxidoreductase (luciferase family)
VRSRAKPGKVASLYSDAMRTGVFLFGGVEMDDAGAGPPAPTDRRYDSKEVWRATEQILEMGVLADRLGFDSFWLTEHHFQFEGYEVVPNGLMTGAVLAERTQNIRIGTMFNVVGQWHPLKLAEDFATLHNLSGGRGVLGIGRGTVPRESENLGSKVGSFDNPDKVDADDFNRKQFDEATTVLRLALDNESFSFHGEVFDFPVPGIPDRGGFVEELSLLPRPLYPYEIWQAVTSPPTLEAVPTKGWGGVMWLKHYTFMKQFWDRFAELHCEVHGSELAPGEKRMLVLNTCVADTHEAAVESVRNGHDEFWKFLGPYGWSRGYMGPDGKPSPAGLIPTLEESIENKVWLVGTADEVAEQIAWYADHLGGIENLTLFPGMPGDRYEKVGDQMHRLAEDVLPQLR